MLIIETRVPNINLIYSTKNPAKNIDLQQNESTRKMNMPNESPQTIILSHFLQTWNYLSCQRGIS